VGVIAEVEDVIFLLPFSFSTQNDIRETISKAKCDIWGLRWDCNGPSGMVGSVRRISGWAWIVRLRSQLALRDYLQPFSLSSPLLCDVAESSRAVPT
jgi:hypothetical protein